MHGKVGCGPPHTASVGRSATFWTKGLTRCVGQSQFLTTPTPAQPLAFNLSLDDNDFENENAIQHRLEDNDTKLMEMLAAQAAHREDVSAEDEDEVAASKDLSELEKRTTLQKSLHNAASNGDVDRVGRLLHGKAKKYIDINAADEEGTAPIIYASCFVSPALLRIFSFRI